MRIIAGSVRGRKLHSPKGLTFRPATGRVKEFIFSVVGSAIEGARVLDLFSGTGALGLEALSRGAASSDFIDASAKQIDLIKRNVTLCGFEKSVRIVRSDVFSFLRKTQVEGRSYDLILADPPFQAMLRERIAKAIESSHALQTNGWALIEHEQHDVDSESHGLILLRQRQFGHCVISIYGQDNEKSDCNLSRHI